MTAFLSKDLRERFVCAIKAGESCRSVTARFGVAASSAVKRYRTTGSVAAGKMGGHRKRVLDPHRAFIVERINQTPHLALHGPKDELASRVVRVSRDTVWKFLRREGLRFKKTLFALEQASLDPRKLVFIDETWIKINMAPLRGYGLRGRRLRDFAPHGHWRTLTFLGALRLDRLAVPCAFDGPINAECFRA